MDDGLAQDHVMILPYGAEPWGEPKQWSSSSDGYSAIALLAEMGIVRAASAFEEYLKGVIAELDRAGVANPVDPISDDVERVLVRLGVAPANRPSLDLVRFFDCARNCIVHQMGRGNAELVNLANSNGMAQALTSLTSRKTVKWQPSIPSVSLGNTVAWLPRHAIMASDAYFKVAVSIDKILILVLGQGHLAAMAAHWSVMAQSPVVGTKRTLIATVRSALHDRYRVNVKAQEIAPTLKSIDKWERVKAKFEERHPNRRIV